MAMSPKATPADAAMRSTVVPTTPVNEEVAVPSAYGRSLAALESTMARRTRRYRNLVVCIVGLIPLAIAVSMFSAASGALVAAVLAVSACSLFAMLDGRGVERWRRGILDDWVAGALDLPAFASMVRALDTLPSTTTETMLATLPSIDDGLGRGALSTATRQMVFRNARRTVGRRIRRKGVGAVFALLEVADAVAVRIEFLSQAVAGLVAIAVGRGQRKFGAVGIHRHGAVETRERKIARASAGLHALGPDDGQRVVAVRRHVDRPAPARAVSRGRHRHVELAVDGDDRPERADHDRTRLHQRRGWRQTDARARGTLADRIAPGGKQREPQRRDGAAMAFDDHRDPGLGTSIVSGTLPLSSSPPPPESVARAPTATTPSATVHQRLLFDAARGASFAITPPAAASVAALGAVARGSDASVKARRSGSNAKPFTVRLPLSSIAWM